MINESIDVYIYIYIIIYRISMYFTISLRLLWNILQRHFPYFGGELRSSLLGPRQVVGVTTEELLEQPQAIFGDSLGSSIHYSIMDYSSDGIYHYLGFMVIDHYGFMVNPL